MDGHRQRFVLKRHPIEAERARQIVARTCRELIPGVALTAELLVSELFTNALQHGRGMITLVIECRPEELRVDVIDHSDDKPRLRMIDPESDAGRGLLVVEALAHAWGADPLPDTQGKAVWFRLQIPSKTAE